MVFVDEIDTTLRLDFTDDFFAAIRFLYQNRAADPALQRLSFVLIGVATPGDLIKDAARTPFNIGHGIELTDFTIDEAAPLADHLPVPEALGRDLIGWIAALDRRPSRISRSVRSGRSPKSRRRPGPPLSSTSASSAVPPCRRRDRQQPAVRPRHADEEGVQSRGGAEDLRQGPPRRDGR